jgi:hypothetical protein
VEVYSDLPPENTSPEVAGTKASFSASEALWPLLWPFTALLSVFVMLDRPQPEFFLPMSGPPFLGVEVTMLPPKHRLLLALGELSRLPQCLSMVRPVGCGRQLCNHQSSNFLSATD